MSALIVNGLPFSGDPYIGPGFYFRELVGWFSLSESKSEVRERKQAHGAFGCVCCDLVPRVLCSC
jgi:hypothetical protein